MKTINLDKGWSVIQDIHDLGEIYGMYKADFDPTMFGNPTMTATPPWKPIPRLEHLQLTFSENPYYGFGLRQYNEAPWWYRNEFKIEEPVEFAVLTFSGVDYFADVWLNEEYLGAHEGYSNPFSFEVGHLLKKGSNLLIVKVRAPWDKDVVKGGEHNRFLMVIRDQMKGTYEHTDTFIPRDVNPIGIWNTVRLDIYDGVRTVRKTDLEIHLSDDYEKAEIEVEGALFSHIEEEADYRMIIRLKGEATVAAQVQGEIALKKGEQTIKKTLCIESPKLWTVWERGIPYLYEITFEVYSHGKTHVRERQTFGIRKIECFRDDKEFYFKLNGEKIYLRGTSYFPDPYISANSYQLYLRDLRNAKMDGLNALRVHVHQEKEDFYHLADEMGFLVMQDTDFNWTHPTSKQWTERALRIVEDMVRQLKNHPSIFCWVLMNEARLESYITENPGPQLMALVKELDPQRPYILNSWDYNDPNSGDSHNYEGSLHGAHTHYTNIFGQHEKLNSEFGMDALPVFSTLRKDPHICGILGEVIDGIDEIQYYQYRYLKYFIEHYRLQKFAPCGGHFQFLYTDTAPSSLFGVYDRCGVPKMGQRAFAESNQPIAVFMNASKDFPIDIWVVNDKLETFEAATVRWLVTDEQMQVVTEGEQALTVEKNSCIRVAPLEFVVDSSKDYTVTLKLIAADGSVLASNVYESAFRHPPHVPGHPYQVHHELALRTYWRWIGR